MMGVMIVDDEAVVRKGIITSIDWDFYGISVVGEAANGKDGLAKALNLKPGIVITDIRMPVMDGLEFSARLREQMPEVKIIILSGYDDFSYARQALKLGVSEYLLKPVGADELIKLVVRLKDEICNESARINREISASTVFNENLPYIQSRFVQNIIKNQSSINEDIQEKAEKIQVDLKGPKYEVAIIDIDDFLLLTEFSSDKDKELLKFSVMNISEEILKSVASCIVCYSEFDYLIALLNTSGNNSRSIYDACKEIQFCVKKYLKITVTIGLGNVYEGLNGLRKSFNEAVTALGDKAFKGKDTIILAHEARRESSRQKIYPNEKEKELINCLKCMDLEKINKLLDSISKQLMEDMVSFDMVKTVYVKLVIICGTQLEEMGIDVDRSMGCIFNPYKEVEKFETVEDLSRWVKNVFRSFIGIMLGKKSEKYKWIVKTAIEYMNDHYSENIRVEDIAEKVYVSPNYFSKVFKEETSENFTERLNKLRVEKAKLLLKDVRARTYEVAEQVGYNDYKYFNYVFKKYTGVSPGEYRKNISA